MGADDNVTVRLLRLDEIVVQLESLDSDIAAALDELDQRVTQLHIQWSGPAAAAHRQAHAKWSEGARLMADGVQRLQRAAAAAHAAFADAAQTNRSLFS